MIEFMVGAIVGVFIAIVISGQDHRELRAENAHMRTALRLARTWAASADRPFLLSIIDRALADEAGA